MIQIDPNQFTKNNTKLLYFLFLAFFGKLMGRKTAFCSTNIVWYKKQPKSILYGHVQNGYNQEPKTEERKMKFT